MTELQIGLAAIGAVVVLGVLAYNRLQERRARRAAERAFGGPRPDALMGEGSGEPARTRAAPASAAAPPDPLLDYVVEIRAEGPAAAARLGERWAALERRHAPRALLARAHEGDGLWRAGLQLVSRQGTVSEAELIEFRAAAEDLAAAAGATAIAPEMRPALEAARALDALCAETDIQVVLHVVAPPEGAFTGTKLRAAAEASGLALEPDGRFALRNDDSLVLYTLAARDGTPFAAEAMRSAAPRALSLALEVPRAPETRRTFESMARLAQHLAALLGGTVVDDNDNLLDERALGAIAAQLEAVRARLEAAGITPGSPTALRLFS